MKKMIVLGSINYDTSIIVDTLPEIGETIASESIFSSAGGKGLNQAVAMKRLSNDVSFIGAIGKDSHGEYLYELLKDEGINCSHIHRVDAVTGQAWITIQKDGKNMIMIHGGANQSLSVRTIDKAHQEIKKADVIVSQFEVPLDVIEKGFEVAKSYDKITVLNPAPMKKIPTSFLNNTDILIPNETELEELLGIKLDFSDWESLSQKLASIFEVGVTYIIVTIGENGVLVCSSDKITHVPAFRVQAVDTTAAGDSFIGAFVSQLGNELPTLRDLVEKVKVANYFASLVVQQPGAYTSIPKNLTVQKIIGMMDND